MIPPELVERVQIVLAKIEASTPLSPEELLEVASWLQAALNSQDGPQPSGGLPPALYEEIIRTDLDAYTIEVTERLTLFESRSLYRTISRIRDGGAAVHVGPWGPSPTSAVA